MKTSAAGLVSLLARNADFRRIFFATVISFLGDWFAFVAVSGLVTDISGRLGMPAIIYAASVLPVFFFSPLAGLLGDRLDRRRMLISVDLMRVIPALGLVAALRWESVFLAIVCVAVLAALSIFFEPIAEAVVPNLVSKADLPLAQAVMGMIWGSMLFVGAALGGLVAAKLGRETSFYINAASFVVSAFLVWRIRRPMQESLGRSPPALGGAWAEVWQEARAKLVTRTLLSSKAGVGVANGIVGLLPSFVAARFGGTDTAVGYLLAARGVGALLGPFFAMRWVRVNPRRIFAACSASTVLYGLGYWVFPFSSSLTVASIWVVVAHLGGGAQWALSTYGLQVTTEDRMRGRVLSLDFGMATLSMGLSSLAAGALADATSIEVATWVFATLVLMFGAFWWLWTRPLRQGAARDAEPLNAR